MDAVEQLIVTLAEQRWSGYGAVERRLRTLAGDPVPAVLSCVRHDDPRVRSVAVALLDHLADDRCLGAITAALGDRSADVRRHAVHSLGCRRCKGRCLPLDVVRLLIQRATGDASVRVRRVAVHQLGLQGHDRRAAATLARLAGDPDAGVRTRAAAALRAQQPAASPAAGAGGEGYDRDYSCSVLAEDPPRRRRGPIPRRRAQPGWRGHRSA